MISFSKIATQKFQTHQSSKGLLPNHFRTKGSQAKEKQQLL